MRLNGGKVCLQVLFLFGLFSGSHVIGIGCERYLRVDNHLPVVRIDHKHVGLQAFSLLITDYFSLLISQEFLSEILFSFAQPGVLKNGF